MTLPETTQEHLPPQYKRTEVGIIPVDWMVKFLRKISLMKSGESITSAKIDESSPYPCYGGNGLRGFTDKYTHDGDYVLIGRQGALCGNVVRVAGQFYASEHAVVATPRDGVDVDWLSFILDTMQLNRISESSAQPGLSVQKVLSLQSVVPPSEDEQRAIATALSDADALIESLDRLIAKKRAIKHAAMQQLLTGDRRLPGFEGEWETKTLGEIAQIKSGATPATQVPAYWGGKIPWCTPTDITVTSGKYLGCTERNITEEGLRSSAASLLPAGSLLLCTRATIGEVKIATTEMCTNQGFKSLVCGPEVSHEFIYYLIPMLKPKMFERAIGSTFLEIGRGDVAGIEVTIPRNKEQEAIAVTLSDMDNEIDALQRRRDKARQIKHGMMQELLTGRTRLVEPQQEAVEKAEA
jgi:type I restriction enzyme S subunit